MPPDALVVVAHPDDETIFFGGVIRRLGGAEILCVTGDAERRAELRRAGRLLDARVRCLGLDDADGPLDDERLERVLAAEVGERAVFTHGVWGEYGHAHHVQVSRAVHRALPNVRSLAGPLPAGETLALTRRELHAKQAVARACYASQPFAAGWCTDRERFVRLDAGAAEALAALALGLPAEPPSELREQSLAGLAGGRAEVAEVAHIPDRIWRPAFERYIATLLASGTTAEGHIAQNDSGPRAKNERISSSVASGVSGR